MARESKALPTFFGAWRNALRLGLGPLVPSRGGRLLLQRAGSALPATADSVRVLRERGFKVEVADAVPGVPYQVRWSDEAEIVVTHFVFDARGHTGQLEVDVERPDGTVLKTMHGVSPDPNDGTFYAVCEAALSRTSKGAHVYWKLYETVDGERRHLGTVEQVPATE